MKKYKLVIATKGFPYGNSEKIFLEPEIKILENDFDITFFCGNTTDDLEEDFNHRVIRYSLKTPSFPVIGIALLCGLFDIQLWKEIFTDILENGRRFLRIRLSLAHYVKAKEFMWLVKKKIERTTDTIVFYSYWFDYQTLGFAWLKKYYKNAKVITRAHGYDVYNEQNIANFQPCRKYADALIDKIIFVCNSGKTYYIEHHAMTGIDKYIVGFLGTRYIKNVIREGKSIFRLLSCAYIKPLKRIDRIINVLSCIHDIEIEWVHLGGGELLADMQRYAQKKLGRKDNIHYEFKGGISHDEVRNILSNQYFDCFITLSETEGLPVSIMEALSVGIPIIAPNVGGIAEEVNSQNGFLLSSTPTDQEVYASIMKLYRMNTKERNELRIGARNTWREKFNANKNFLQFANILTGIAKS